MTFEEWFNVEFGYVEVDHIDPSDPTTASYLSCWNAAISAALDKLYYEEYYYDNGNKWNDDCYSSTDPKSDIKKLLTA